jgi:AcrR family transcriptional regulator
VTSTRRRGSALDDALLDAAWSELREVGYAGLTMEVVAQRAGTSRPVLARRWPNRPQLVIAALRRHRPVLSGEVPDTGDLRDDVLALLRRVSTRFAEVGPDTFYGPAARLRMAAMTSFPVWKIWAWKSGTKAGSAK